MPSVPGDFGVRRGDGALMEGRRRRRRRLLRGAPPHQRPGLRLRQLLLPVLLAAGRSVPVGAQVQPDHASQSGSEAETVCSSDSSRPAEVVDAAVIHFPTPTIVTTPAAIVAEGYDRQFAGKACVYSASAPFSAHGLADGNGVDAVSMMPARTGSTVFATPTEYEWLAFAAREPGICTCSHEVVHVDQCMNGACKGRSISGGGAGDTCDCTVPMFGVLQCSETDDEQLFYGDLAPQWEAGAAPDLDAEQYRIYAMGIEQGGNAKVVSMVDNNELFKNNVCVATLNRGERWVGAVNDFDEFSASGPIYGSVRAASERVMATGRLKGRVFSFGNRRRPNLRLWARAMEADASCSVRTTAGQVEATDIPARQGHLFSVATVAGSNQAARVVCDADIVLAIGQTEPEPLDYMVVPPESFEWYGVISTILHLSQSSPSPVDITESCSDGSTQTLTIPAGGYEAGTECWWRLSCSDVAEAPLVTFETFATVNGNSRVYAYEDAEAIGDGDHFASLHGSRLPDPLGFAGDLSGMLAMRSAHNNAAGNAFQATVTCQPQVNPCVGDGLSVVNGGQIDFPAGPGVYRGPRGNCDWLLSCSDPALAPLVTFSAFDTNSNEYLNAYDGISFSNYDRFRRVSGNIVPSPIAYSASEGRLRFAKRNGGKLGFEAAVECVAPASACMSDGDVIVDGGVIDFPGHGGNYRRREVCNWVVRCSDAGMAPSVEISAFDTHLQGNPRDQLKVYRGTLPLASQLLEEISGDIIPSPVSYGISTLLLRFTSNADKNRGLGFHATITCPLQTDPCLGEGVVVHDGQTIDFVAQNSNHECTWTLSCSDTSVPRLDFHSFGTQGNVSNIYALDGADAGSALLMAHSGTSMPAAAAYRQSVSLLRFSSDSPVSSDGFQFTLACQACTPECYVTIAYTSFEESDTLASASAYVDTISSALSRELVNDVGQNPVRYDRCSNGQNEVGFTTWYDAGCQATADGLNGGHM